MRHNCNIFRAIRFGYVRSMIRYCNAWGWKHFWADTFVNWWRVQQFNCPVCGGINHRDRLGKIGFLSCGCIQSNAKTVATEGVAESPAEAAQPSSQK